MSGFASTNPENPEAPADKAGGDREIGVRGLAGE
jgi:hypothetical protein